MERNMGLGRRFALGAGDFGFNLYWQTASIYLLFFYTDVLGLPPAVAGVIYMAALIWDAALDPLIGSLADRTRTRFGRYRPYLLFGGLPLALIFAAMFAGPAGDSTAGMVFAAVLHVGFRSLYAVISIPYASLFARVTRDARIRADLAGIRMVFATVSALLVASLTLPLVKALGTEDAPRRGWVMLALIFGVIASSSLLLAAWAANGYDKIEYQVQQKPPMKALLRSLYLNRPLMLVLGAVMIASISSTLFGKNLLYYFKYVVGRAELGSAAMGVVALVAALSVPIFTWLARTYGKRRAWLAGAVPAIVGICCWHLADGMPLPFLFMSLALCAMGTGAYGVCFWSMLPDTVEYGEWRSGVRAESLVFGCGVLAQKVALGIGAGVLGLALEQIGYLPNELQSAATLNDLKQLMFWVPLIGGLGSAALIYFYPIGLKEHARIVEEIAARKLLVSE